MISALLANFILLLFEIGLYRGDLSVSILMGVICCLTGLSLCGAYRKMWRYFNQKDYISCIAGVAIGIGGSCLFTYILRGTAPILYTLLYGLIAVIGVSLFRYIFKSTFIDLTNVGRHEAKYKRTMIIGEVVPADCF